MHPEKPALLSTAYFGPVQYFSKFLIHESRLIEVHDHYSKQTYRNRCMIYGANGALPLSIPVLKGPGHKTEVRDIRLDDTKSWKKMHWKGIVSAYMHSPFFEFYMDEIRYVYSKDHRFLLDLNIEILRVILPHLDMEPAFKLTSEYMEGPEAAAVDYRELIHPKKDLPEDPHFNVIPYQQVFGAKHGFIPNLSILDLLFNEGPNSRIILKKSVRPAEK